MPILRNPFARRPDTLAPIPNGVTSPSFERVDTVGSRASSALSINSGRSQEPAEYKLSVVNDDGVYLPPSPTENKGQWPRRYPSVTSSSTRTSYSGDIDPFPISRESFDSFRRSFDISAKSPISPHDIGRSSIDSSRFSRYPRSAMQERRFELQPPTAEEVFEDIGLQDEPIKQVKRRGFFSRFGDDGDHTVNSNSSSIFHMGRKRGHSSGGQELGNIAPPDGSNECTENN